MFSTPFTVCNIDIRSKLKAAAGKYSRALYVPLDMIKYRL